jgi:hypothetical protein
MTLSEFGRHVLLERHCRNGQVKAFLAGFEPEPDSRIVPAACSPSGFTWYEACVDFALGDRRSMLLSSRLIGAL